MPAFRKLATASPWVHNYCIYVGGEGGGVLICDPSVDWWGATNEAAEPATHNAGIGASLKVEQAPHASPPHRRRAAPLCLAPLTVATLSTAEYLDFTIKAGSVGPYAGETLTALLLVAREEIFGGDSVRAPYGSAFGVQRTWVAAPPCPRGRVMREEDLQEFLEPWHLNADEIGNWCVRRSLDVKGPRYPEVDATRRHRWLVQPPTAIVAAIETGPAEEPPWGVARTVVRAEEEAERAQGHPETTPHPVAGARAAAATVAAVMEASHTTTREYNL